jgi:hypothetical protein
MFFSSARQAFRFAEIGEIIGLKNRVIYLLHEVLRSPDTERLREFSIQAHPLGFLCIKWDLDNQQSLRIHIWDRNLKSTQIPNWPIHDHVFKFRSVILVGSVQNKTYQILGHLNKKNWNIFEVVYEGYTSKLVWRGISSPIKSVASNFQSAGTYYDMSARTLHRTILRSDFAVTVLATTRVGLDQFSPIVVGDHSKFTHVFDRRPLEINTKLHLMRKCLEILETESTLTGTS